MKLLKYLGNFFVTCVTLNNVSEKYNKIVKFPWMKLTRHHSKMSKICINETSILGGKSTYHFRLREIFHFSIV